MLTARLADSFHAVLSLIHDMKPRREDDCVRSIRLLIPDDAGGGPPW